MRQDESDDRYHRGTPPDWPALFARGLTSAVGEALEQAAGQRVAGPRSLSATLRQARDALINGFPLLGGLLAGLTLIEDARVCAQLDVAIAAVCPSASEIYLNPDMHLEEPELRFVLAHEALHAGLRHDVRRQGRDPYLWNIACDYVINGWLVEMKVGRMPAIGGLHDPELAGMSAEAIYDVIVTDLRRYRKLRTFRGGEGDILDAPPSWWGSAEGMALDAFYRRALTQGLSYHEQRGRGLLPAGLVEEIRALDQPPIPWDVALAQWFDQHFPPLERRRTYARPSRRQAGTPDIPLPRYVPPPDELPGRTFGVVLDTSGSMDRVLLAKALGAIASYSQARDVSSVRVVFCDAAAYDQGYMPPEALLERVSVRGRGGTVLQPGIDILERAPDFPPGGPLLVITDGECDRLRIAREHAFLMPGGASLPFVPLGPVFRVR